MKTFEEYRAAVRENIARDVEEYREISTPHAFKRAVISKAGNWSNAHLSDITPADALRIVNEMPKLLEFEVAFNQGESLGDFLTSVVRSAIIDQAIKDSKELIDGAAQEIEDRPAFRI